MRTRPPHQGLPWRGAIRFGSWTSWSSWFGFPYAALEDQFFLIKKKGGSFFSFFIVSSCLFFSIV
jgi:hypothetical protein